MVFSMRKKLVDKFTRNLGSALQTLDVEEIRNTINVIYNETMETPGVHGWEILEMIRQCGSIFIMRLMYRIRRNFRRNLITNVIIV